MLYTKPGQWLPNVISRDAAAALMWRLGCFTELEQSKARANVPTDLDITRNWSICLSVRWCDGVQTKVSKSSRFRLSGSSEMQNAYMNTDDKTHHVTFKNTYCTCKNQSIWTDMQTIKTNGVNNNQPLTDMKYSHWQKHPVLWINIVYPCYGQKNSGGWKNMLHTWNRTVCKFRHSLWSKKKKTKCLRR